MKNLYYLHFQVVHFLFYYIGSDMQNIEQIKKLVIKKINNNVYADITNINYYKFNKKHLVYKNYKKIETK